MKRSLGKHRVALALAATVAIATPAAAAAAGPSVISEATVVRPGDRYMLDGAGWFAGPRCEPRVEISGHGVRVGAAAVRDTGTFSFWRRVPRGTPRGTRIALDVTQYCAGVGTTRTVTLRVGRARRTCGGTMAAGGDAYRVKVFGGLSCASGAGAVGPFIDTGIAPPGWSCAPVDAQLADLYCVQSAHLGLRVTAHKLP
jgi:hypothetical protein